MWGGLDKMGVLGGVGREGTEESARKEGCKIAEGRKIKCLQNSFNSGSSHRAGTENDQLFFNSSFQITVFSLQSEINKTEKVRLHFLF